MKKTNLSDGTTVEIFESPPRQFQLEGASIKQLLRHGFPPLPPSALSRQRYVELTRRLSPKLQWVEPSFTVLKGRGHGRQTGSRRATNNSGNWCGVFVSAPAGGSVTGVAGSWVIPNVSKPKNKQKNYSCHWIGIDGMGSAAPLFQAGVECDISVSGTRDFYAWYEWLPDNPFQVKINNIKITAGDYVTAIVCADSGAGSTTGTVYFTNTTSGQYTSFRVTAPKSALLGATGEWVSEITQINGVIDRSNLADFGEVYFGGALATTTNNAILNCLNGTQIQLQDPVTSKNYGIGVPIAASVIQTLYESS